MKFPRAGSDLQAYLYLDAGLFRASLYLMAPGADRDPVHTISGPSEAEVEDEVRAWVEAHFPRDK